MPVRFFRAGGRAAGALSAEQPPRHGRACGQLVFDQGFVEGAQARADFRHGLLRERMACGVGDDAVHGLRQRRGGLQQAVKGVFFRRDLGHIQAQGDLVQGDVVFVVGQGYLRVVAQLHQVQHARLGQR